MRRPHQRGAAAVEMALVLPLLISLVMGIIDFGYAFMVQGTVAGAAREGARVLSITNDTDEAIQKAAGQVEYLDLTLVGSISASPADCTVRVDGELQDAVVLIPYELETLTGFFEGIVQGVVIEGRGVMRCGG